uniref:Peroxin-7 n=1 Tax=Salix viminalis TaxID=40686 RepID=A0A6N2KEL6_SALVM
MALSSSTTPPYSQHKTHFAPSRSTRVKSTPSITTPRAVILSSSSSWDDTIKLWTLDRPASIRTFNEHAYCVHSAVWNSRHTDVFASASGDRTVRIWDVREPGSTMIIPGHDCIIATASVDKRIRVWDVRSFKAPILVLNGHGYAVRKVKFSPHHRNFLVSCSYDRTVVDH